MDASPSDVDGYLATLPDDARSALGEVRRLIRSAAPDAVESISYGMPTFKLRGRPLIYFAAARKHCALYGTREGTLRFPPDQPPAEAHLTALIRARVAAIEAESARPRRKSSRPPSPS